MEFSNFKRLLADYEKDYPRNYLLGESYQIDSAKKALADEAKNFTHNETYDVFLSHAHSDARIVRQVRKLLLEKGLKVYVDWIEDKQLDRSRVSSLTALLLRHRMDRCASIIYLTSTAAKKSVWMPWELGYMDAC